MAGLSPQAQAQFTKLRRAYVDGLSGRKEQINQALDRRDLVVLGACAHRLKGSAASFGFAHLSQLAMRLEQSCEIADWQQAQESVAALRSELDQIQGGI